MTSKKNHVFSCFFSFMAFIPMTYSASSSFSTDKDIAFTQDNHTSIHSLLIFLDDTEQASLGAASEDFLAAFVQKSAPIIVSASLIENITSGKRVENNDPQNILDIANNIAAKQPDDRTLKEKATLKDIYLSLVDTSSKNWIIKEINPSLYLLFPRKYLAEKRLSAEDVTPFLTDATLTQTELSLGLKVNHMKTVTDITIIQRPNRTTHYIDYFVPFLEEIFVTRKEYKEQDNKTAQLPSFNILISGHGLMGSLIAGLSIVDFKQFLSFLEKIKTRFLMYMSCYAAGTNTENIYNDTAGITRTFDFPIITTAITDAVTYGSGLVTILEKGTLVLKSGFDFECFVKEASEIERLDIIKVSKCSHNKSVNNIPQIKYPGLPWFSVLNPLTTASIGRAMTKLRTEPLNIATFFAKTQPLSDATLGDNFVAVAPRTTGKPAEPVAILLYTENIPFELIINTNHGNNCYVPTFVSMIPEDATHHLKKISSACNTSDALLNSFFIDGFERRKIFIIDQLEAPFSTKLQQSLARLPEEAIGTLYNVIVDFDKDKTQIYFSYNNNVYTASGRIAQDNSFTLANDEQKAAYFSLLNSHALLDTQQTNIDILREQAKAYFNRSKSGREAGKLIFELLKSMPNLSALKYAPIIKISASAAPFLRNVVTYRHTGEHKLLWFETIKFEDFAGTTFKDVIIEITPDTSTIFFKEFDKPRKITHTRGITVSSDLEKDYANDFEEIFAYFDENHTIAGKYIDASSVYRQASPETMNRLKDIIEKKLLTLKL